MDPFRFELADRCLSAQAYGCASECPPSNEQVKGWGKLLELFLGSNDNQEFTFPWILRRVETLSILTDTGEKRRLSLDIDTHTLFECGKKVREAISSEFGECEKKGDCEKIVYQDSMPVPFALFSKGILLDFSAKLGDKSLSLEKKSICWLAGFAWLLQAAPNKGVNISEGLRKQLWWICRHRPEQLESDQIETLVPWTTPPDYWLKTKFSEIEGNPECLAGAFIEELYSLLFMNDQPTIFYHRLKLLSTNYYPLVVVPFEETISPRTILKFDYLYGKSAEMWYKDKKASHFWLPNQLKRSVQHNEEIDANKDAEQSCIVCKIMTKTFNYIRLFCRTIVPHGPWPWSVTLFGDLEGHCEHTHIALPTNVELVGGSWDDRSSGLQKNIVELEPLPSSLQSQLYNGATEQEILEAVEEIQEESHVKFFRNIVTVRRHKSLKRSGMLLKFGLLPSLDGVFGPLIIVQILLFLNLNIVIGSQVLSDCSELKTIFEAGVGAIGDVSLLVGLVSTITATVVKRLDQPLREMMLQRVYRRSFSAIVAGSIALYFTIPIFKADSLPPSFMEATIGFAILANFMVAYALYFLVHTWVILRIGRHRLNNKIGLTQELHISLLN